MEFIVAKCPNCSGELDLPDDTKQAKCKYCGFDIMVREAANASSVNIENLLKLASTAEETGNPAEAYKYFTQVLEYEPNNYVALLGKGIAAGSLSTPTDFRANEVITGVKKALECAPEDKKEDVKLSSVEKINSVCSACEIDYKSKEPTQLQRYGIVKCLELAYEYDPENEDILTNLYFQHRYLAISSQGVASMSKVLDKSRDTSSLDKMSQNYTQKAEKFLSELKSLHPKKASTIIASIKEAEEYTNKFKVPPTGGGSCLITMFNFIVFILGATILIFTIIF